MKFSDAERESLSDIAKFMSDAADYAVMQAGKEK